MQGAKNGPDQGTRRRTSLSLRCLPTFTQRGSEAAAVEGNKSCGVHPNTRETATCVDWSVEHGVSHLRRRRT